MFTRRSPATDDKRIVDFIARQTTFSETALSLAYKLKIDPRAARRILDEQVEAGELHSRVFGDIETIYYRNPGGAEQRAAG